MSNDNGSNRLPILLAQVRDAHADVQHHEQCAAEQALAAGVALAEAKALCRHGEWLPWLAAADIPERSAQRYMNLHHAGLKSDTVSYLGLSEAHRLATKGLRLFPQPAHLKIGSGEKADGEVFMYWAWRHSDDLAGYGFLNSEMAQLTQKRPVHIWGLGMIHDALTRGARRINGPEEVPYSASPGDATDLTRFDSLEPWLSVPYAPERVARR